MRDNIIAALVAIAICGGVYFFFTTPAGMSYHLTQHDDIRCVTVHRLSHVSISCIKETSVADEFASAFFERITGEENWLPTQNTNQRSGR